VDLVFYIPSFALCKPGTVVYTYIPIFSMHRGGGGVQASVSPGLSCKPTREISRREIVATIERH